ncbi:S8 family peptidase [Inhella gelatinilytica]|uniref:S8 family serine peptidase n=1 Tax=Inhella gelatinilytica TaxID=2795030 RepID=A0A931IY36_9BURK|nr:S8 family serine peptidase [Inhella gelatinilytica]MBH9552128.1 S8 family serine peptidase [Inhella gelatinilytica]
MQALQATAREHGAAPVMVHLLPTSLEELRRDRAKVKADAAQREAALLAELGAEAWRSGRWRNEAGQVELYLTEAGLRILSNSNRALHFWPGRHWSAKLSLDPSDYRVVAIEKALKQSGQVSIAALPHLDQDADYELAPGNKWKLADATLSAAQQKLAAVAGEQVLADGQASIAASSDLRKVGIPMRLNRQARLKILEEAPLRGLWVDGSADPRPLHIDPEALTQADQQGLAEVVVTLRNPMLGALTRKSSAEAQRRAHRQAFQALRAAAKIPDTVGLEHTNLGVFTARLTGTQLRALANSQDGRMLSIALNRPRAKPMLATSTATLNMPVAWNLGYTASGQAIVVMDTGVQRDHAFFRDGSGNSRITLEACYGSSAQIGSTLYESRCPSAGPNGDSPLGLVGSAAPVLNCSTEAPDACSHGTHVTGIAAGRNEPLAGAGTQGVAPSGNIVAVQVFSFDVARKKEPGTFDADLLAAMDAVINAAVVGNVNPITVNLSLGGGYFSSACPGDLPAMTTAFGAMRDLGVPVVAATGNAFANGLIAWPACVPHAIKVSSTVNDGVGNTRSAFANVPFPDNFPGEAIWMAPGGGGSTSIRSSIAGPGVNGYDSISGTSMASPHIAGLYAAAKDALPGQGVDAITAFFRANFSQPVSINVCPVGPCGVYTVTLPRIRL